MVDQLHCQDILSRRLDVLFNSLSSESAKRQCPTCCQPFIFAPARSHSSTMKVARVRLLSSFSIVMLSSPEKPHLQFDLGLVLFWDCEQKHACLFCRPPVLVSICLAEQVANSAMCIDMKTLEGNIYFYLQKKN
jgi:hypothetical protein